MAKTPAKSPDKQARLAQALRANLKRRKAKARELDRALVEAGGARQPEAGDEPAGEAPAEAPASPDPGPNPAQKGA